MTRNYVTARGQTIDMDKLKLTNEQAIAVGNMRINARGDAIGANGEIAAGRNQLADQMYATPDAIDNGEIMYSPNNAIRERDSHSRQLHELANSLAQPSSIEAAEHPEEVNSETDLPVPAARGSLADAIAKTAVVKQELVKNPLKKPDGPRRL